MSGLRLTAGSVRQAVRGPWPRRGELRPGFGVLAAVLAGVALALWVDPAAFSLPPLGARFAGSWTLMLATLAAWAALYDEARLARPALLALPLGALAGALRTGADPGYVAALVALALSAAPGAVARTPRAARSRGPRPRPARP